MFIPASGPAYVLICRPLTCLLVLCACAMGTIITEFRDETLGGKWSPDSTKGQ